MSATRLKPSASSGAWSPAFSRYSATTCEPGASEVFTQGFDNLFYAAPAVADDHYNYLADAIEALPEAERPKTAAYASMEG